MLRKTLTIAFILLAGSCGPIRRKEPCTTPLRCELPKPAYKPFLWVPDWLKD